MAEVGSMHPDLWEKHQAEVKKIREKNLREYEAKLVAEQNKFAAKTTEEKLNELFKRIQDIREYVDGMK